LWFRFCLVKMNQDETIYRILGLGYFEVEL
jgi:hypothetical protein